MVDLMPLDTPWEYETYARSKSNPQTGQEKAQGPQPPRNSGEEMRQKWKERQQKRNADRIEKYPPTFEMRMTQAYTKLTP